jgi:hypothetical protein
MTTLTAADDQYKDLGSMNDEELARAFAKAETSWHDDVKREADAGRAMKRFLYESKGQWDQDTYNLRKKRGKSRLQNNVVGGMLDKALAEQIQYNPQVMIIPRDEEIPTEVVEAKIGIYEDICYESNAPFIYMTTYRDMLTTGAGAAEIVIKREHPRSPFKVARIVPIMDINSCFWDIGAELQDKTDSDIAGRFFTMSLQQACRKWTDEDIDWRKESVTPYGSRMSVDSDEVGLRSVYYRIYKTIRMVQLPFALMPKEMQDDHPDGIMERKHYSDYKKKIAAQNESARVVHKQMLKGLKKKGVDESDWPLEPMDEQPIDPIEEWTADAWDVYHCIATNTKILDKKLIPGDRGLLHYACGKDYYDNGRQKPQSWIKNAIAPQEMANYAFSEIADSVHRSIGVRIFAHKEAIAANRSDYVYPKNSSLQEYGSIMSNPDIDPRPSVVNPPAVDMSLLQLYQASIDQIKETLGRPDESLGNQTNAVSGYAIELRQSRGDLSTTIPAFGLNQFIAGLAKHILELIPHVYDTERNMVVRVGDGDFRKMRINHLTGQTDDKGNYLKDIDMQKGKATDFVVEAYSGPSFAQQREDAYKILLQLSENDDRFKGISIDLMLKQLPFSFINQLIKRAKSTNYLNPQVQHDEDGKPLPKPQESETDKIIRLKQLGELGDLIKTFTGNHLQVLKTQNELVKYKKEVIESAMDTTASTAKAVAEVAKANAQYPSEELDKTQGQLEKVMDFEVGFIEKQEEEGQKQGPVYE